MTDNDEVDTGSYVVPGSDWTEDENFWRTNYTSRPYASSDQGFEVYRSAYRYGHDAARQHRGRRWSEVESELRSGWRAFEGRAISMLPTLDGKTAKKDRIFFGGRRPGQDRRLATATRDWRLATRSVSIDDVQEGDDDVGVELGRGAAKQL